MVRIKTTLVLALLAAPAMLPAPAMAQNAAQDGVLVIFGNDKCPTNADGEEIVVCRRLSEEERFRIPKQLRDVQITPQNESWAVRQQGALATGATGIGSCSTVGPGGGIGCLAQQITAGKKEARQRRREEQTAP